ncbi:hypothetical protein BC828DRAFT_386322 [Blastocladiella britannica]|nr:hypothetical protein BC828DRAFT_386322 [Blastocladiella britannica]
MAGKRGKQRLIPGQRLDGPAALSAASISTSATTTTTVAPTEKRDGTSTSSSKNGDPPLSPALTTQEARQAAFDALDFPDFGAIPLVTQLPSLDEIMALQLHAEIASVSASTATSSQPPAGRADPSSSSLPKRNGASSSAATTASTPSASTASSVAARPRLVQPTPASISARRSAIISAAASVGSVPAGSPDSRISVAKKSSDRAPAASSTKPTVVSPSTTTLDDDMPPTLHALSESSSRPTASGSAATSVPHAPSSRRERVQSTTNAGSSPVTSQSPPPPPESIADADAARLIGNACYGRGELTSAREYFARAVDLAPQCVVYLSNLAACEYELGQYETAAETSRKAVVAANAEQARLANITRKCMARIARCGLLMGGLAAVAQMGAVSSPVPTEANASVSAAASDTTKQDLEYAQCSQAAKALLTHDSFAIADSDPEAAAQLLATVRTSTSKSRAPALPLTDGPLFATSSSSSSSSSTALVTSNAKDDNPTEPPMLIPSLEKCIAQGLLGHTYHPATSALSGIPYMVAPPHPGPNVPDDADPAGYAKAAALAATTGKMDSGDDVVDLGAGAVVDEEPGTAIRLAKWTRGARKRLAVMFAGVDDGGRGLWLTIMDAAQQALELMGQEQHSGSVSAAAATASSKNGNASDTDHKPPPYSNSTVLRLNVHVSDRSPTQIARVLVLLTVMRRLSDAVKAAAATASTSREGTTSSPTMTKGNAMRNVYRDPLCVAWAALAHYLCFGHLMPASLHARLVGVLNDLSRRDRPERELAFLRMDRTSWGKVQRVLRLWAQPHPHWDAVARNKVVPRALSSSSLSPSSPVAGGTAGSPKASHRPPPSDGRLMLPNFAQLYDALNSTAWPLAATSTPTSPSPSASAHGPPTRTGPGPPVVLTRASKADRSTHVELAAACALEPTTCPLARYYRERGWTFPSAVSLADGFPTAKSTTPSSIGKAATKGSATGTTFSVDKLLRAAETGSVQEYLAQVELLPTASLTGAEMRKIARSSGQLGQAVETFYSNLLHLKDDPNGHPLSAPSAAPRMFMDEIDDEQMFALYFRCLVPPSPIRSAALEAAFADWHCISRHGTPRTADAAAFVEHFEAAVTEVATEWVGNVLLLPEDLAQWSVGVSGNRRLGADLGAFRPVAKPASPTSGLPPFPLPHRARSTSPPQQNRGRGSGDSDGSTDPVTNTSSSTPLPGIQVGETLQMLFGARAVWESVEANVRAYCPHPPTTMSDWSAAFFAELAQSLDLLADDSGSTGDGPALRLVAEVSPPEPLMVGQAAEAAAYDRVVLGGAGMGAAADAHASGWLPTLLSAGALLKPTAHAHLVMPPFPCVVDPTTISIGGNRWQMRRGSSSSSGAPPTPSHGKKGAVVITNGQIHNSMLVPRPALFYRHSDESHHDEFARAITAATRAESIGHLSQLVGLTPLVLNRAALLSSSSTNRPMMAMANLDYRWAVATLARDLPAPLPRLAARTAVAMWLHDLFAHVVAPHGSDTSAAPSTATTVVTTTTHPLVTAAAGGRTPQHVAAATHASITVTPAAAVHLPDNNSVLSITMHGFFGCVARLLEIGYPRHWIQLVLEDLLRATWAHPMEMSPGVAAGAGSASPTTATGNKPRYTSYPLAPVLSVRLQEQGMANWSPFALDYLMALAQWLPALRLGIKVPVPLPRDIVRCVLRDVQLESTSNTVGISGGSPRALAVLIGPGLDDVVTMSALDRVKHALKLGVAPPHGGSTSPTTTEMPRLRAYVCQASAKASTATAAVVVPHALGVYVLSSVEWTVRRSGRPPGSAPQLEVQFDLPAAYQSAIAADPRVQVAVVRVDTYWPVAKVRSAREVVVVDGF